MAVLQEGRHPGADIALSPKAKRRWAMLGMPLAFGLLFMATTGTLSALQLAVYAGPGVVMVAIFANVDAWLDEEGLHHRSAETWGMTRLVPAGEIARAQVSSPPGPPTLRVLRHDGSAVNIVAVRKRFVGEADLQRWVDVINNRFAGR